MTGKSERFEDADEQVYQNFIDEQKNPEKQKIFNIKIKKDVQTDTDLYA